MKNYILLLLIFIIALLSFSFQVQNNFKSNNQIAREFPEQPLLEKPAPPPPPQDRYIIVSPNSPRYYVLPGGYPLEYYSLPQYYFYFEPCYPYYRPGISIFIGSGWWHTPGCGLINIGWYSPSFRPFPIYNDNHCRTVIVNKNISNTNTTININKINNINVTNKNTTPPPPPPPPPVKPNLKQDVPKKEDKQVQPKKEDKQVQPKKEDKQVQPKKEDKQSFVPKQDLPKQDGKKDLQPSPQPKQQSPSPQPKQQSPSPQPKQQSPSPQPKQEIKPNKP